MSDNAQYFKITKFVIVEANPLERQLMFFTIFPVIHNVALLTIYFFFPCLSMFKKDNNSVLDNYACSKVAFLHPLKKQFRKNPYIPRDRPESIWPLLFFVCFMTKVVVKTLSNCLSYGAFEVFDTCF